ncbi:MAG: hypothetical protein ACOYID_03885 [Eubacteriales bacterium]|jgi:ABC-type oligopeptide transport system substrate-binding subunit|nr:hypothetical protein [Clostridiales bacterium]
MNYYDAEPKKKGFSIGKLFKWLLALLTFSIYLLLTLRACALDGLKDTAKTRALLRNEKFVAAYSTSPESIKVEAGIDNSITTRDGRITVTNIRWIEPIDQFQLTVRYNNSLARVIMDDFSLKNEPVGEYLTFALRDDAGNLYTAFEYITDSVFVYNFRRLVFDDVRLEDCNFLRLEVYYTGYVNYNSSSAPINSITIYNKEQGLKPYNPKKGELSATTTTGLTKSRVWANPASVETESDQ